jgi:TolB-like protein/tetratricopeptide (TPR) repeat protein
MQPRTLQQAPIAARSAALAVLAIAVAGMLAWVAIRPPVPSSPSATPPAHSVAVMPFVNLTGDDSKEYFGDGMAEELINLLARVPGLSVAARTSAFAYKGHDTDVRAIAQHLGVATVLEGSVRSAGERIRISTRLVDANTGYPLWSESYDREFKDVFALQDDIAGAVSNALADRFGSTLPPPRRQVPTRNTDAYRLFLRARAVAGSVGDRNTLESFKLLDQAIALDPRFAEALALRARWHVGFNAIGHVLPHALEDAERDAGEALGIDPNLSDAHWALGINDAVRGNWLRAEASFRRAIALNAGEWQQHNDYALFVLASAGHMQRALAECYEAYRLAPSNPVPPAMLAAMYALEGKYGQALQLAARAKAMGAPAEVVPLPQIYAGEAARAGRYREAAELSSLSLIEPLRRRGGADTLRKVYEAIGDPRGRSAAIDSLRQLIRGIDPDELDSVTVKDLIGLFVGLGSLDDAFALANSSLDGFAHKGTVGEIWANLWGEEMRPFRHDPRFQILVRRLKLPDYWARYGPPDGCEFSNATLVCH